MRHHRARDAGDTPALVREARVRANAQPAFLVGFPRGAGRSHVLVMIRIAAAMSQRRLARDLAAGTSPATTRRHALRAAQLTSPSSRARMADALVNLTTLTTRPVSRYAIEPSRPTLLLCQIPIHELASRLTGPLPVYAHGIAQLKRLLCDGTGPLYTDRRGESLKATLAAINDALAGKTN